MTTINEKGKRQAPVPSEPEGVMIKRELQPSLKGQLEADIEALEAEGRAELDRVCKETLAELEAAFAPAQQEFERLRKEFDDMLKMQ